MKSRQPQPETIKSALSEVTSRVAPVWPLDRFVAVNPYLGMLHEPFEDVVYRLGRVSAARATLPAQRYLELIELGELSVAAIDEVLAESRVELSRDELLELAAQDELPVPRVRTAADVIDGLAPGSWSQFTRDHLGAWMASYFDHDFAAWQPNRAADLFKSWKTEAELDRTPEVLGARGFRSVLKALPDDWTEAVCVALRGLSLQGAALDLYLHRLLMQLGGWSAHAARLAWERRLRGEPEGEEQAQLLAVLVVLEFALKQSLLDSLSESAWQEEVQALGRSSGQPGIPTQVMARVLLQLAYERTFQQRLASQFDQEVEATTSTTRPHVQAVFCIDVRSEVFRRHLEAAADDLETLGFAGFFGFPVEHIDLGHSSGIPHCPVLLNPSHRVPARSGDEARTAAAIDAKVQSSLVSRAVKSFKLGSVSCFGFVSPLGLGYLPKLLTDAFGLTRPVKKPEQLDVDLAPSSLDGEPRGIPLGDQITLAARALKGMSLTTGFARLVLIAGHGATSVNNPHASGLDCGACGGRAGGVNARVAARVLNDPDVRDGLRALDIHIPADTYFIAGLHDTTTDEVSLFEPGNVPADHRADVEALRRALDSAGESCRAERARRLGGNGSAQGWFERSRDWAQVRPEWGLAGCAGFIAAPRTRTAHLDLDGRAFLHSYDWQQDDEFGVLESIMTAPMVVASWINLQYYASTVDPEVHGAGNKTLHNVIGGNLGVFEGNTGDLRVGLPWQSVHDGSELQHAPIRLNVVIEAPIAAMNAVIDKHPAVRQLLDNGWIHLCALDENGRISHRYAGGLRWRPVDAEPRDSDMGIADAPWSIAS